MNPIPILLLNRNPVATGLLTYDRLPHSKRETTRSHPVELIQILFGMIDVGQILAVLLVIAEAVPIQKENSAVTSTLAEEAQDLDVAEAKSNIGKSLKHLGGASHLGKAQMKSLGKAVQRSHLGGIASVGGISKKALKRSNVGGIANVGALMGSGIGGISKKALKKSSVGGISGVGALMGSGIGGISKKALKKSSIGGISGVSRAAARSGYGGITSVGHALHQAQTAAIVGAATAGQVAGAHNAARAIQRSAKAVGQISGSRSVGAMVLGGGAKSIGALAHGGGKNVGKMVKKSVKG